MTREPDLFAWVGEDEYGSGEIGLKRARVPSGDDVPMVATRRDKVDRPPVTGQLQRQVNQYGQPIRLVRYVAVEVLATLTRELMHTMTRGDFVTIECEGRTCTGMVLLASANGRSIMVGYEGILAGFVGAMPISQQDDGTYTALTGAPVTLTLVPRSS